MSAIATYLRVLLEAEYGEQVRHAIVDAITKCYQDATAGMLPEITSERVSGGHNLIITIGAHVETVFVADGDYGPSPTVTMEPTETGVKITVVSADGTTSSSTEVSNGTATDEQVSAWLDEHPEATTTVQDGAVTNEKLADDSVSADKIEDGAVGTEKIAKNLLPLESYCGDPFTKNGVTFTRNSDGSITMEGVADDDIRYEIISYEQGIILKEGYYTISCTPEADVSYSPSPLGPIPTGWDYQFDADFQTIGPDSEVHSYGTFGEAVTFESLVAHGVLRLSVRVQEGTDYSTPHTIYPMLQPGRSATEYINPKFSFDYVLEMCEEQAHETSEEIGAVIEDVDLLKANLEDLDDRVEALESGGGSGLTESIKTALMNVVNHIAWDDDDPTGQTYITALYDALYPPAPPASLTSITAVYTQSGSVYDTDSLNDLKSDLVVTAHYSDSTSHAVTDYTLSGTLAVGTSVIAVNYNGKSTTFTVTVTAGALYPLENGSHTFTSNNRVLTVTNGNHFVYEWSGATTAAVNGAYLNLSTVSDNDTSAEDASNITLDDALFTIPANAQVVFEIKNISFSNVGIAGSSNKYAFNIRNGATSLGMGSGDKGISDAADISIEKTFDVDTPATCIFLYVSRQFSRFEADISLTVNGVRWI